MNRFVFRLESVLRFRELQEQQAEAQELRCAALLRKREGIAEALRRRLRVLHASLQTNRGLLDLTIWQTQGRLADRLSRALADAMALVQDAVRQVQEANALRQRRAREAEVLRQLRQQRQQVHLKELVKQEQQFLDEISMRRWSEEALEENGELP